MADLPPDRLDPAPPFTNVGLDVFGDFKVKLGKATRSRSAEKKVWIVLFTCLSSRAVHPELIDSFDTSTFKNVLHCFLGIRGKGSLFRNDKGKNFVGSRNQDKALNQETTIDIDDIRAYLNSVDSDWIFNPAHASHFGGVWERKIGSVRRVLEGTLQMLGQHCLTRDELHTLLVEASAIVNSAPLWELFSDPEAPQPLCPAMILTLHDSVPYPAPPGVFNADSFSNGKRLWRRAQYLADQFWTRWQKEYIQELQSRRKWRQPKKSLVIGDIVLLRDKQLPRNHRPATWENCLGQSRPRWSRQMSHYWDF